MVSGFDLLGSLFDTWSFSVHPSIGTRVLILSSSSLRPEASSSTIQTFVFIGNALQFNCVLGRSDTNGVLLTEASASWTTPPHIEKVIVRNIFFPYLLDSLSKGILIGIKGI